MNKIEFSQKLLQKYTAKSPSRWKKLGFAMLPTSLLNDPRLSRSCLVVFWVLTAHLFRGKKYCFPSIKTIADEAHMSSPTAIKAIKQLKQHNYLEIEGSSKSGKANRYFLNVIK